MYSTIRDFISKHVKTYTDTVGEQENKQTDDKLEKIFIDTQAIPEKHNSKYVADVLSIPDIDKIIIANLNFMGHNYFMMNLLHK
jgi:hypothetical protein